MKKLKKIIYIYMVIYTLAIFTTGIFVGLNVLAQKPPFFGRGHNRPPHENRDNPMKKRFARKLNLTEQQQQQIDDIMDKYHPEFEEQMQKMKMNFHENRLKIKREIDAILTSEQMKKFDEIEKKLRGNPFSPPPPPPPPPSQHPLM